MGDVPTMQEMEEYVPDMGQKVIRRLAVMKDVPIMQGREEYVSDMVPKLRHAVMKDVPKQYRKKEYVSNTEQSKRKRLAVMKNVPTTS